MAPRGKQGPHPNPPADGAGIKQPVEWKGVVRLSDAVGGTGVMLIAHLTPGQRGVMDTLLRQARVASTEPRRPSHKRIPPTRGYITCLDNHWLQ